MEKAAAKERVNRIALARFERWALPRMARRLPGWITPDTLTAIGLIAAAVISVSYYLTSYHLGWLWLASAGFVVHDDTSCMVNAAYVYSRFLAVESCGQCPPCKLGGLAITDLLERLGPATESRLFARIESWLRNVTDGARCFLATEERQVVGSLVPDMRDPRMRAPERGLLMTKLVDLVDGRFVVDEAQGRKRPDWTYAPEDG